MKSNGRKNLKQDKTGYSDTFEDIRVGSWFKWITAPIVEDISCKPRWYSYLVLPQKKREDEK